MLEELRWAIPAGVVPIVLLMQWRLHRRRTRDRDRGVFRVWLRAVEGEHPGIRAGWRRHARLTTASGVLRSAEVEFGVHDFGDPVARRPRGLFERAVMLRGEFLVLRLQGQTGAIEVAVAEREVERFAEMLVGGELPDRVDEAIWEERLRSGPISTWIGTRVAARQPTGPDGSFEAPERSERSRALDVRWDAEWPGLPPLAWEVSEVASERRARFTLWPESMAGAPNRAERDEALLRLRTLFAAFDDVAGGDSLTVIAPDWAIDDAAAGITLRLLPEVWPWRIHWQRDDGEERATYVWALGPAVGEPELQRLWAGVAAEPVALSFLLLPTTPGALFALDWLGVTLLLPEPAQAEALRERFAVWLRPE